jgi:hypothetical protein
MNYVIQFQLFIVKTREDAPRHHGLHTNTSEHLLARRPEPGDVIVAVLDGTRWVRGGVDRLETEAIEVQLRGKVERHGGRSAMLGEDTHDEAFGGNALADLIPEVFAYECGWNYAPVQWTEGKLVRHNWEADESGEISFKG